MSKILIYKAVVKFEHVDDWMMNLIVLKKQNDILTYQLRDGKNNKKLNHSLCNSILPIFYYDIQEMLKVDGLEINIDTRKRFFDKLFGERFIIISSS